jgi:hypothetical protein
MTKKRDRKSIPDERGNQHARGAQPDNDRSPKRRKDAARDQTFADLADCASRGYARGIEFASKIGWQWLTGLAPGTVSQAALTAEFDHPNRSSLPGHLVTILRATIGDDLPDDGRNAAANRVLVDHYLMAFATAAEDLRKATTAAFIGTRASLPRPRRRETDGERSPTQDRPDAWQTRRDING